MGYDPNGTGSDQGFRGGDLRARQPRSGTYGSGDAEDGYGGIRQSSRQAASALEKGRSRLIITGLFMALAFLVVSGRLVVVTAINGGEERRGGPGIEDMSAGRSDIQDRNGQLLATSLITASLFADPQLVLDPVESAAKLTEVLTDLEFDDVLEKLSSGKRFVWIKRYLTPRQHALVHRLGLPGLEFMPERRRFYPTGSLMSHVVGYTDIDNNGLAGMERFFDKRLKATSTEPLVSSLDQRIQHILKRELQSAMEEFRCIGANGMIMDVRTGELLAMVSLPDFDPLEPGEAADIQKFNRNGLGVYEMGSTFKIFNTAMALDSGKVRLNDTFDATRNIQIGRFTISDFHGKYRHLSVAEIFKYSSNIGSVRMALSIGTAGQRSFMAKMGFTKPAPLEISEVAWPLIPNPWREINTMTISFGHGISVSALHTITAAASVVNGGIMHKPTLVKVRSAAEVPGERVVSQATSEQMRRLFRLVVSDGTATKADVPGYLVGGKTGTADKQKGRHYNKDARLSSFIGAFPINDPKYIVMVMLDEPKPSANTYGYATAGWTAAPAVGHIIRQIGPLLGVQPVDDKAPEIRQALDIEGLTSANKGATLASFQPDHD